MLGGQGAWSGMPHIAEVEQADGPSYPVITGDHSVGGRWGSAPIRPGTALAAPAPLFAKLDPAIADEELARLESS